MPSSGFNENIFSVQKKSLRLTKYCFFRKDTVLISTFDQFDVIHFSSDQSNRRYFCGGGFATPLVDEHPPLLRSYSRFSFKAFIGQSSAASVRCLNKGADIESSSLLPPPHFRRMDHQLSSFLLTLPTFLT